MNSEKVKEIKKGLECCTNPVYCEKECPYHIYERHLECINELAKDSLTLINELECENKRLAEERDLYKEQFNELEPRFFDLRYDNKELKDRIAELEKGNEALSFAVKQGFNDCQAKTLKQFAERLIEKKVKLGDRFNIYDIDETLKECLCDKYQ